MSKTKPLISRYYRDPKKFRDSYGAQLRRAKERGDEYATVLLADQLRLFDLTKNARGRIGRPRIDKADQDYALASARAWAWVQIARGAKKDEAYLAAYQKVSGALGWKIPTDLTTEPTARRPMERPSVTRLARCFIDSDTSEPEGAKFWSQFPDLTEADRERICAQIKKKPGFRPG